MGRRGGMDPEKMADERTNRLKESLDLDNKQTKKVRELTEDLIVNTMALNMEFPRRDTTQATRQARREAMKGIEADYNAEMQNVLNEEQYAEYEKLQAERREKMAERRKEGRQRPPKRQDGGNDQ